MNETKFSSVVLSVCIPTYNRPQEFERLLIGLAPQITNEIELVIRDDSSNCATRDVFERISKGRAWNTKYLKGEKIGVDAANLLLVENAQGKYVWWLSDDDEIRPNAITKIIELLKRYPLISFLWINFCVRKSDNLAVSRDDGFFKDRNDVIETLGTNIGLLSTILFRRDDGLLALPLAKKHIVGFSFAHLVLIFHVLSGGGQFYFLKGPYILAHPTTPEEFKKTFNKNGKIENMAFNSYGVDFYNIVKEFDSKFKSRSIKKLLSTNFASLWRGMLVAWIGGWDTPEGKRWKMFKLYWTYPECWIALPLFLLPLSVNRFFFRVYKIFFSHRKWVFGKAKSTISK